MEEEKKVYGIDDENCKHEINNIKTYVETLTDNESGITCKLCWKRVCNIVTLTGEFTVPSNVGTLFTKTDFNYTIPEWVIPSTSYVGLECESTSPVVYNMASLKGGSTDMNICIYINTSNDSGTMKVILIGSIVNNGTNSPNATTYASTSYIIN